MQASRSAQPTMQQEPSLSSGATPATAVAWEKRRVTARSQAEPSALAWGDTEGQKGEDSSEVTCKLYHICTCWQKGATTTSKSDRYTGIQLSLLLTSPYCELEHIHSLNASPPSAQGRECDMLFKQSALMR